jgi:MoaA/NifB/PqqE/SkfB family radical SAM enzyme
MRTFAGHQIYNWHLELSSKCALKCPRCTRTEYPGTFPVTQLGLDFIKKIFTPELLRTSAQRITFSGGVGDPLYNSELPEIYSYLKQQNPRVQIVLVTNGSHKTATWWQQLLKHANGHDEIIFSIDGWDHESNNLYRVNSDWQSMMTGVDEAVKSQAYIRWSTIAFQFNENHLDQIKEIARSKGVDSFHTVLSERFGQHYIDPQTGLDPLEPSKEFRSAIPRTQRFKEVFKNNPQKKAAIKEVFEEIDQSFEASYQETLKKYEGSYILPTCKFGYRGLYVDVEGILYPCSWVSHQFDVKASHVNPKRLLYHKDGFIKYKDRLNLHFRSLEEVLQDPLWQEIESGWKSEKDAFIICERKCLAKNSQSSNLETKETKPTQ